MATDQLQEHRRSRLRALIGSAPGAQKAFADRVKRSASQINDMLSGIKPFGEKVARDFERVAGLAEGYFDQSDGQAQSQSQAPAFPEGFAFSGIVEWDDPSDLPEDTYAMVSRRRVKLAAGSGTMIFEEEPLPPLAFTRAYLQSEGVTRRENLVTLYADGHSMAPYISDGDAILIDQGQTTVIDGKIYAINYGGELRIKRLRKRFDGGLVIISDSTDQSQYPPETLTADEARHIRILGKFIWRGGGAH